MSQNKRPEIGRLDKTGFSTPAIPFFFKSIQNNINILVKSAVVVDEEIQIIRITVVIIRPTKSGSTGQI